MTSEIWNVFDEVAKKAIGSGESLHGALDKLTRKRPEVLSEVKYKDLIKWFVEQPRRHEAERGAILRRAEKSGHIAVVQIFLDKNSKPLFEKGRLCGRKLITQSLDQELLEYFGKNNTIIVD